MEREWGNGERMRKWREIDSLHFLILSPFPPPFPSFPHSLSISSLSLHFLHQNLSHFHTKCWIQFFVANITKKLTYALWGNNSGSNSLRGSSASCAGLPTTVLAENSQNEQEWNDNAGRHNLRSFLAASSTQNYFLTARMLRFFWRSRQKCHI